MRKTALVVALAIAGLGCQANDPFPPLAPSPNGAVTTGDSSATSNPINTVNITIPIFQPPVLSPAPPPGATPQANRPPVVSNPGPQFSVAGDAVNIPMTISDPDGNALALQWTGCPRGITVSQSGIQGATTPSSGLETQPFFCSVTATEIGGGQGLSTTEVFQWTVTL